MADQIANPLIAAVCALGGAVTYLFRLVIKQGDKHSELSSRIGRLEGEHSAIEKLSESTLEVVRNAIRDAHENDTTTNE